jgi:2-phospho-L-lactate/phosphoenolpyruvate guanylyltransferase
MTPDDFGPSGAWTIIIPVKNTRVAKTRLTGFSPPVRSALALAFVLDSATAALSCRDVGEVLAVTNDEDAAVALTRIGVRVLPDAPDAGLNAAVEYGVSTIRHKDPQACVAAMLGDLPALQGQTLEAAFAAAVAHPRWLVADADGTGTTLLAASDGAALGASFGARSREAHRRSGAIDLVAPDLPRLRRDVDTEQHLLEAVALGVGAHTSTALAALALAPSPLA